MYRPPNRIAFKKIGKNLLILVSWFLLVSLLSLGFNFGVYCEIQKRLGIHLRGRYLPTLFLPRFKFYQGSFVWKNRVQLVRGDFELTFDPLTVFSKRGIRVIVTSKNCRIKLLGDWVLQGGVEAATVDSMIADIFLGRHGLTGVNQVEVQSPSFQFSLKNVDKKVAS